MLTDEERRHMQYDGWRINGVLVHPVFAYTSSLYWLRDFEAKFPDKAKRMCEYSKKKGWGQSAHDNYWYQAVINWLNKNGTD